MKRVSVSVTCATNASFYVFVAILSVLRPTHAGLLRSLFFRESIDSSAPLQPPNPEKLHSPIYNSSVSSNRGGDKVLSAALGRQSTSRHREEHDSSNNEYGNEDDSNRLFQSIVNRAQSRHEIGLLRLQQLLPLSTFRLQGDLQALRTSQQEWSDVEMTFAERYRFNKLLEVLTRVVSTCLLMDEPGSLGPHGGSVNLDLASKEY